jgi:hypothetical protein
LQSSFWELGKQEKVVGVTKYFGRLRAIRYTPPPVLKSYPQSTGVRGAAPIPAAGRVPSIKPVLCILSRIASTTDYFFTLLNFEPIKAIFKSFYR